MSNLINLYDPIAKYGPLSNNFISRIKINKKIYKNVTEFIYKNMIPIMYQQGIKKDKDIFMEYIRIRDYIKGRIQQNSLEEALNVKYSNPDMMNILLSTGNSNLVYVSGSEILGNGRSGKGMNLVGRYSMQIRNQKANEIKIQNEIKTYQNNIYEAYLIYESLKKLILDYDNNLSDFLLLQTSKEIILKYGQIVYPNMFTEKSNKFNIDEFINKIIKKKELNQEENNFKTEIINFIKNKYKDSQENEKIIIKKFLKNSRDDKLDKEDISFLENISKTVYNDTDKYENVKYNQIITKLTETFPNKNIILELYSAKNADFYPLLEIGYKHPNVLVHVVRQKFLSALASKKDYLLKNKIFDLYIDDKIKNKYPDISYEEYEYFKKDLIEKINKKCVCGKGIAKYNKPGEEPLYCSECKYNYKTENILKPKRKIKFFKFAEYTFDSYIKNMFQKEGEGLYEEFKKLDNEFKNRIIDENKEEYKCLSNELKENYKKYLFLKDIYNNAVEKIPKKCQCDEIQKTQTDKQKYELFVNELIEEENPNIDDDIYNIIYAENPSIEFQSEEYIKLYELEYEKIRKSKLDKVKKKLKNDKNIKQEKIVYGKSGEMPTQCVNCRIIYQEEEEVDSDEDIQEMVITLEQNYLDAFKNRLYNNWKKFPNNIKTQIEEYIYKLNIPLQEDITIAEAYKIPIFIDNEEEKKEETTKTIYINVGDPPENFGKFSGDPIQLLSPIFYTGILKINNYEYPTVYHYIIASLLSQLPYMDTSDDNQPNNSMKNAQKYLKKNDGENYTNYLMNWLSYKQILVLYNYEEQKRNAKKIKELASEALDLKFSDIVMQNLLLSTEDKILVWGDDRDHILGTYKEPEFIPTKTEYKNNVELVNDINNNTKIEAGHNFVGEYLTKIRTELSTSIETQNEKITINDISTLLFTDLFFKKWMENKISEFTKTSKKLQNYLKVKNNVRINIDEIFFATLRYIYPTFDNLSTIKELNIEIPAQFSNIARNYTNNGAIINYLWIIIVNLLSTLINKMENPTLYNLKITLTQITSLLSNNDNICIKIIENNNRTSCILSGIFNLITALIKFQNKLLKMQNEMKIQTVDKYDIETIASIILDTNQIKIDVKLDFDFDNKDNKDNKEVQDSEFTYENADDEITDNTNLMEDVVDKDMQNEFEQGYESFDETEYNENIIKILSKGAKSFKDNEEEKEEIDEEREEWFVDEDEENSDNEGYYDSGNDEEENIINMWNKLQEDAKDAKMTPYKFFFTEETEKIQKEGGVIGEKTFYEIRKRWDKLEDDIKNIKKIDKNYKQKKPISNLLDFNKLYKEKDNKQFYGDKPKIPTELISDKVKKYIMTNNIVKDKGININNISKYITQATYIIDTYKMDTNIKTNRINFFATLS
jgi:predicted NAD-dependent protein-ADP-ribosyltransferase YbiA (DUF1768 family)